MSVFNIIRALSLAVFVVFNCAVCAIAAVNLAVSKPGNPLMPVDGYLLFTSSLCILFIAAITFIDILRRGALTSRVWFECSWMAVAWLMNLCGASAVTALSPVSTCQTISLQSCSTGEVLLPITWTTTLLAFVYLLALVICALNYSARFPEVWVTGVRDFQWFHGGGSSKSESLGSGPPTPAFVPRQLSMGQNNPVPQLEQLAARWQPPAVSQPRNQQQIMTVIRSEAAPAPVPRDEPQPLTYSYAPAISPTRVPVHYNASAVVSVGVLPDRRPTRKANTAPTSFYNTSVQSALPQVPPKRASTTNSYTPSQPRVLPDEPAPIRDWPRPNPQEPYKKDKHGTAQVATSTRPQPAIPMAAPGSAPTPSSSAPRRSRSGTKPRPPPLDLTSALPNRTR